MSTVLNAVNCSTSGGNTGAAACALDIKNIVGAIILPKGTSFSAANTADAATFLTALQTATLAVSASRAYPIHGFEEIKDSSETEVTQTLGYGGRSVVREGYFDWTFQFIKGGLCLSKQLRKFNNKDVDVLFVDANGLIFGKKVGTALQGIPQAFVYSAPFKINDGAKTSIYTQRFTFKPDFIDSLGFVQLGAGDFDSVLGLQDVVLSSGGARVTNVSLIKAVFSCGGLDLHDLYATALAVANLWIAKDSVSGNLLTITSVANNTNIGGWTGTLDVSDPDYDATHPVIWSLAASAALNTAGILAIESIPFTTPN